MQDIEFHDPTARGLDRRVLALVGLVVVGIVAVLVLGRGGGGDDAEDPYVLLGIGDCLDLDDLSGGRPIDCDRAHDGQVFAKPELADAGWPGEVDVVTVSESACIEVWDRAVGTNFYTDTRFDFVALPPNEARWEVGDREVVCVLTLAGGGEMLGDQLVR